MKRLFYILVPVFAFSVGHAEITIHSDFEGGSVEVLELDAEQQFVKILPADHPGKGWRCWWYFRVDGLQTHSSLILDVGDAPWATPERAHLSRDGGQTWQMTSTPGTWDENKKRIRYVIPTRASQSLLLAWGPPFTPRDSQKLVETVAGNHSIASAFNLATTREGRQTPALKITAAGDDSKRKVIWIQARQHAWESGSSFVAKGLIEYLCSDAPAVATLLEKAVIYVVPIMDIDNTARGAGGKNQKPQDHNRDWSDDPHWHAVAAAQKMIRQADDAGRFAMFIDLHNPAPRDLFPFFYIPERNSLPEAGRINLDRFIDLAKQEISGPLRFTGRTAETGKSYDPRNWRKISKNWVAVNMKPGTIAATLETSWNTPSSNTENYAKVGEQLVRAIARTVEEF